METLREKYNNDPNYRRLVDAIITSIEETNLNMKALKDAFILASFKYGNRLFKEQIPLLEKVLDKNWKVCCEEEKNGTEKQGKKE